MKTTTFMTGFSTGKPKPPKNITLDDRYFDLGFFGGVSPSPFGKGYAFAGPVALLLIHETKPCIHPESLITLTFEDSEGKLWGGIYECRIQITFEDLFTPRTNESEKTAVARRLTLAFKGWLQDVAAIHKHDKEWRITDLHQPHRIHITFIAREKPKTLWERL